MPKTALFLLKNQSLSTLASGSWGLCS